MHPRPTRFVVLAATIMLLAPTIALGYPVTGSRFAPGTPAFQRTWERTDQPVAAGQVSRTWMWGPEAFTEVRTEPYAESPGGQRQVQYFDKSRMEITNPGGDQNSIWYVTNGLLVVELMTGMRQTGDDRFEQFAPAQVNVAGDADDPLTYAVLAQRRDDAPLAVGAAVTQRIDAQGRVSDDPTLAARGVTAAVHVAETNHTVASPFWSFMTSSGPVLEDGQLVTAPLFVNPYYATGLPLIEAHWATVKIGGAPREVLLQCFERRCLTYTPDNPPGWQVEAGNVGQHYYRWRYEGPQPTSDHVVINEVLYWPEVDDRFQTIGQEWVELYNPTGQPVSLDGWVIANDALTRTVTLPAWTLPHDGYLVVAFGDGADDPDFADGSATWYAGASSAPFFTIAQGGAALYSGAPAAASIVDFLAWSSGPEYADSVAQGHATATGGWPAGEFVDTLSEEGTELLIPVVPGQSIGRDRNAADTNSRADWGLFGGADSYALTPGARNDQESFYLPNPLAATNAPRQSQPQPKKEWTVMVYMDGRAGAGPLNPFRPGLDKAWVAELDQMEASGSDANVNIVAQLAFRISGGFEARRWFLEPDNNPGQLRSKEMAIAAGVKNPGSAVALSDFVTWASTNFPANKYAIILAGHGKGWKALNDLGPQNDFLTMAELRQGLQALGQKFETVIFEACLMGMVEVGYQIEDVARYMVASEEISVATFRWTPVFNALKQFAVPGGIANWDGRGLAEATVANVGDWHKSLEVKASGFKFMTIASVDLAQLKALLMPRLNTFAQLLRQDMEDVKTHDTPDDNAQILVKTQALYATRNFTDQNFIDLKEFADWVKGLPVAAAGAAQPVIDALKEGGPVILRIQRGEFAPNTHGLSIYFPRTLAWPDEQVKVAQSAWPAGTQSRDAFDDPQYDPANTDTHLYKRDPDILLPRLAGVDHAMRDDPGFLFPTNSDWDEFLHRYYKPTADACVRKEEQCLKSATFPAGTTVTLSGIGSSDSDAEEQENNVPAHTTTTVKHYYWDFDPNTDNQADKPAYQEGTEYTTCTEDCDRNDDDGSDDDPDAVGETVSFPCSAGVHDITLWVWDEHHDQPRRRNEDRAHNQGRHWLHFNVHRSTVRVGCVAAPIKYGEPLLITREDREITWTILIESQGGNGQYVFDTIHEDLQIDEQSIDCSSGGGGNSVGCAFDSQFNAVYLVGDVPNGQQIQLTYVTELRSGVTPESHVTNCAEINDGTGEGGWGDWTYTLCGTVEVVDDGTFGVSGRGSGRSEPSMRWN